LWRRINDGTKPSLTLKRRLKASPAKVYRAWTDPEQLLAWWGPAGAEVLKAETDPRIGGRYHFTFRTPEGEEHGVGGTFREVVPDEKLVFTWAWRSTPVRQSLVTVICEPDGEGTLLTLFHEQFFDEPARDRHETGWKQILDRLANHLDAAEHGGSQPETETGTLHNLRFPDESAEYRAARNALLREEMALRRQIERVAARRLTLPPGGMTQNYQFESAGGPVKLSELFGDHDTLIAYSFMFGPQRERPCSSCTSMLSGLDGHMPDILQRVSFAVIAGSPIGRLTAFARERGWKHLRLMSSHGNSYSRDYHAVTERGSEFPLVNVFSRRGGTIRHFYCGEQFFVDPEPGQDPRHVDATWPLWNILDLTPDGRGADWRPQLSYDV
jgi:predicted dithiol-disulfide oxidoreductase (DUF899 family)/uncharacterized protein YndB with AHSA1/START domain